MRALTPPSRPPLRLLAYATALGGLAAAGLGLPPLWLGLLALALCGFIALGLLAPGSGIFARPVLGIAPGRRLVALTFDDGPDPAVTPAVLDLLEARGHRATFFVIGRRAEAHPELVRAIVQRGHQVANHSFAHAYATPLWSTGRLAADLARAQDAILRAAGVQPRWFRPPVGLFGPRVESAARRAGLRLCGWSLRSNDGSVAGYDAGRVRARVVRRLRDGQIVLLHDGPGVRGRAALAPLVLPALLDALEAQGLRSVTLDALVELSDDAAHANDCEDTGRRSVPAREHPRR